MLQYFYSGGTAKGSNGVVKGVLMYARCSGHRHPEIAFDSDLNLFFPRLHRAALSTSKKLLIRRWKLFSSGIPVIDEFSGEDYRASDSSSLPLDEIEKTAEI